MDIGNPIDFTGRAVIVTGGTKTHTMNHSRLLDDIDPPQLSSS
ncbi:hypothetical protein ACWC9U_04890 [Streptomyces sp. 900116325]